jgi:putative copper resistance protein D
VAQLLDIFGFISVLLRGLTLAFEALTVGGVLFALLIQPSGATLRKSRPMLAVFSILLAVTQFLYVLANSLILVGTTDIAWTDIFGAQFLMAGGMVIGGALLVFAVRKSAWGGGKVALIACALILCGSVMSSHSVSRLEDRWLLVGLTFLHHLMGDAWIGGMPYLIVCLQEAPATIGAVITSRFSKLALTAVPVLVLAGIGLGYFYVGDFRGLTGATYGIMLLAKVILTMMLLALGARNLQVTRALRRGVKLPLIPLQRFAEAEVGIGFTVLLAAASLTSTPPAIDVRRDIVTGPEIAERMRPVWPRLDTPPLSALSPVTPLGSSPGFSQPAAFVPGQLSHPDTAADRAWSEYNHHWAGLVVLAIGLASLLARRISWARYWPLLFLGLAVFLFLRADSENWPLGPRGFWESFQVAEVAQHRLFVLLVVAFAVFETAVQIGKLSPLRAGLVFPLVCAVGGALLLTHSHSLTNAKEEFLAELSHIPLALAAVAAGWSRWLEIRLPTDRYRGLAWIWPVCFVLIGVVLLNYREN